MSATPDLSTHRGILIASAGTLLMDHPRAADQGGRQKILICGPNQRPLPLHHHEPGHAARAFLVDRLAGSGFRFGKELQGETSFKKCGHVGFKRPMPVLDADAAPFEPERSLAQVIVDREMKMLALFIPDPAAICA